MRRDPMLHTNALFFVLEAAEDLPLSSNNSTVGECPNLAARCRGPTPPREGRLTSAPWSTRSRTRGV